MESNGDYLHPNTYMDKKESMLTEVKLIPEQRNVDKITSIPNSNAISNLSRALKSNSSYVFCPFCNHQALTKTNKNMNIINLLASILSVIIGWAFWQCLRGKDYNCYNVEHYCLHCDKKLADYNAC